MDAFFYPSCLLDEAQGLTAETGANKSARYGTEDHLGPAFRAYIILSTKKV